MADVIFRKDQTDPTRDDSAPAAPEDKQLYDIIELLFFAYRDFVSDPDAILAEFGFGRAHHRVLHFVKNHPGMPVADLLEILKITKQSLGRVLKQLVETGYIEQRPGPSDRRQRLLYATKKGVALADRLVAPQKQRIAAALESLGIEDKDLAERFLLAMINERERGSVRRILQTRD